MTDILYHGSITPGITALEARSRLHGTDEMVVYLTSSGPYALFYIWDSDHTGYHAKYVTGGFRDGIAFYEEQFPDQMRTFYQGVSGYLYYILPTEDTQAVTNRPGLFAKPGEAAISHVDFIPDVYEALLQYEAVGQLRILRYNEQTEDRREELDNMIASYIRSRHFFENDVEQQMFMQRYFEEAWRLAHEQHP